MGYRLRCPAVPPERQDVPRGMRPEDLPPPPSRDAGAPRPMMPLALDAGDRPLNFNRPFKITALAMTCAIALAACGNDSPPSAPAATAPAASPAAPSPADAPPADAPTPAAQAPAGDGKPAAVVSGCATTIEGSDALQFNVGSITVPTSCSEFTITLKHTGQMAVNVMGHNVVIAKASDRVAISTDGMAAGLEGDYVKPDDARVIAHTKLVGGGATTSVTFPVSKIQGGGPYEFFCSFPGHWAVMTGTIQTG